MSEPKEGVGIVKVLGVALAVVCMAPFYLFAGALIYGIFFGGTS